jgi:hypothetical protein
VVEKDDSERDSNPQSTSPRCSDVDLEQDRDVRARAWRFVFDCYAKKKGSQGEDPAREERSNAPSERDGCTR